jgi:pimeloyl-ACP methyl ester carboxylesterase
MAAPPAPPPRYLGGEGPPLVLLHGGGGTWRQWELVIPLLSQRFHVLAPTMAWHWSSDHQRPDPTRGIDALADGVIADIDVLGWERPVVVGGSLGGWVALRLAARGRAGAAVAISPAGGWRTRGAYALALTEGYRFMGACAERFPGPLERALARPRSRRALTWHHFAGPNPLSADLAIHLLHSLAACDGGALMGALERADGPDTIRGTACPTLLIYPRRDFVVPRRTCRRLQAALDDPEEVILEHGGHAAMVDAPEAVAAEIERFASRSARGLAG